MKYLLILLFLVGCVQNKKYKIGQYVKTGDCYGYIERYESYGTNYLYKLVKVTCTNGLDGVHWIKVIQDDIDEVISTNKKGQHCTDPKD